MEYFELYLTMMVIISWLTGAFFLKIRGSCHLKNIINFILLFLYSLLIAFRPQTVADTKGYNQVFWMIDPSHNYGFRPFEEIFGVEYGFLYFMKWIKWLWDDVHFFYFVLTFTTAALFLYGSKKILKGQGIERISEPIILSIYMSYYGTYYSAIAIRQGIALSLGVLALAFLIEKKYLKMTGALVAAFLFHRLAVLNGGVILVFLVLKKEIPYKFYAFLFTLPFLYFLFNTDNWIQRTVLYYVPAILRMLRISNYIGWLEDYTTLEIGLSYTSLYICGVGGLLVLLSLTKPGLKRLLNIYLIGIAVNIVFLIMSGASRVYDFFTIYSVLIAGGAYTKWSRKRNGLFRVKNLINIIILLIIICNLILFFNIIK